MRSAVAVDESKANPISLTDRIVMQTPTTDLTSEKIGRVLPCAKNACEAYITIVVTSHPPGSLSIQTLLLCPAVVAKIAKGSNIGNVRPSIT
jgi:hypothetical protein